MNPIFSVTSTPAAASSSPGSYTPTFTVTPNDNIQVGNYNIYIRAALSDGTSILHLVVVTIVPATINAPLQPFMPSSIPDYRVYSGPRSVLLQDYVLSPPNTPITYTFWIMGDSGSWNDLSTSLASSAFTFNQVAKELTIRATSQTQSGDFMVKIRAQIIDLAGTPAVETSVFSISIL